MDPKVSQMTYYSRTKTHIIFNTYGEEETGKFRTGKFTDVILNFDWLRKYIHMSLSL